MKGSRDSLLDVHCCCLRGGIPYNGSRHKFIYPQGNAYCHQSGGVGGLELKGYLGLPSRNLDSSTASPTPSDSALPTVRLLCRAVAGAVDAIFGGRGFEERLPTSPNLPQPRDISSNVSQNAARPLHDRHHVL